MIGHSDIAYVIDRSGRTRAELNFDPGPGTASTQASFADELSSAAQQNLWVLVSPRPGGWAPPRSWPPCARGLAGCGSAAPRARRRRPRPPVRLSLATSAGYPAAAGRCSSWAARSAATTTSGRCSSGPARNDGLEAGDAARGGQQRRDHRSRPTVARPWWPRIRPSQDLSFSPLARSATTGRSGPRTACSMPRWPPGYPTRWRPPRTAALIALTRTGDVEVSAHPGAAWTRLATARAVAAAAARGCGLARLTAVAYSPVRRSAGWRARAPGRGRPASSGWPAAAGPGSGPRLPATLARPDVDGAADGPGRARPVAALLAAGTGRSCAPARGVVQPGR